MLDCFYNWIFTK